MLVQVKKSQAPQKTDFQEQQKTHSYRGQTIVATISTEGMIEIQKTN